MISLASQYLAVYDGWGIRDDAVYGICDASHRFIVMSDLGYIILQSSDIVKYLHRLR